MKSGRVIAKVSLKYNGSSPVLLTFDFSRRIKPVYIPLPDRDALRGLRDRAHDYLEEVLSLGDQLTPSWSAVTAMMRKLMQNGFALALALTGEDRSRIAELQVAFRRAWPLWNATAPNRERLLPIVEMQCHDGFVPIELLPVFDFFAPVRDLENHGHLLQAAAPFLGFSAVVRRVNSTPLATDRVLRNVPALPVQFIRHKTLGSLVDEATYLSSLAGVEIDGPWPTVQDDSQVLEALTRSLFFGKSLTGNAGADPPVQVHHFACHCNTDKKRDDDYELVFSTQASNDRRVTLAQLREAHRVLYDELKDKNNGPVVFINACGSSRIDPLTSGSFPRFFLSTGHRAFIGAEVRVPDDVAFEFARSVYGRLIERKRTIGNSVALARHDLLRDFRNPLGLLYVMYGSTELRVEYPRPGLYRNESPSSH